MKLLLVLLFVMALFVSFGFNSFPAVASGLYVCPSCQKVVSYDANIKQVHRLHPVFGFDIVDSVLYCPYCGYNTERDSTGNIKLSVVNLWESKYGVAAYGGSAAGNSGCGCVPMIVLPNASTSYSADEIKNISESTKTSSGSYPKIKFSDNIIIYPIGDGPALLPKW